jgi:hypothetical protein
MIGLVPVPVSVPVPERYEQLQTRNTVTGNLEPAEKKDMGPVSSDKEQRE